jgi:hypothetical protein
MLELMKKLYGNDEVTDGQEISNPERSPGAESIGEMVDPKSCA